MNTEYYRHELSNRLKLMRSELGLTQSELAALTGLSRGIIQNCEAEKSSLTYANLMLANENFNKNVSKGVINFTKYGHSIEHDYFVGVLTSTDNPYGSNDFVVTKDGVHIETAFKRRHMILRKDSYISLVGILGKTKDMDLHEKFTRLSSHDQKRIVKQIDNILEMYEESSAIPHKKIPLIGLTACGNPIEAIEETDEFIETQELRADFALRAVGDSMSPVINNDDIILIKKTEELNISDIGIFQINDSGFSCDERVTCKVLKSNRDGLLTLSPLNPTHDPIIVDLKKNEVKIIGKYLSKE